jgi:D-arabinose 1-dehydrogenase-like Zn-dependent alcohol dehydrogenase
VTNLRAGDRVVVPFPIACGSCGACEAGAYSICENSNPNAHIAEKLLGHAPCGIFGYSHLTGGFAGGQAEYARVPFADVGPLKVPDGLTDDQVLFLTDILPTGYMGAEMCGIRPGDTVAVWGCGPVGQFAIASAYLLGAERVVAIDRFDTACRWRASGRARSRSTTPRWTASRRAQGPHRRPRPRPLHRRGGGGGATRTACSTCTTAPSRCCARRPTGRSRCARRS